MDADLTGSNGIRAQKFRVYGERNSGTNLVEALLKQHFPQLEFVREFPFEKHAFMNPSFAGPATVCVVVFRSADAWIKSFFRTQHQIWGWAGELEFSDFIRHEWRSHFSGHLLKDRTKDMGLRIKDEVMLDRHPETGRRIANIVELRNLKIQSHLKAKHLFGNWMLVRYEDVVEDQLSLVRSFSEAFKTDIQGVIGPIEKNLSRNAQVLSGMEDQMPGYADFSDDDIRFILDRLWLKQEAQIGYRYDSRFAGSWSSTAEAAQQQNVVAVD